MGYCTFRLIILNALYCTSFEFGSIVHPAKLILTVLELNICPSMLTPHVLQTIF